MKKLVELKKSHEAKSRYLVKKENKAIKKEKQNSSKAAQIQVQKFKTERSFSSPLKDSPRNVAKKSCHHTPQCILRDPFPPPYGPRTLSQTERDNKLLINEAVQIFTGQALDFLKQEDDETLHDTITKLEAVKHMLKPLDEEESVFDEIIESAKYVKDAIESLGSNNEFDDKNYFIVVGWQ